MGEQLIPFAPFHLISIAICSKLPPTDHCFPLPPPSPLASPHPSHPHLPLSQRLEQVSDEQIYNYPEKQFNRILNKKAIETEEEYEDGDEEDPEHEDYEEDGGDEEDQEERRPAPKKRRIEQEDEQEDEQDESEVEDYEVQYVEDFEESDEEIEELPPVAVSSFYSKSAARKAPATAVKGKGGRKGNRIEIEYEQEIEEPAKMTNKDMDFNF